MKVAIIGTGNLHSVVKAFGGEATLDPERVRRADRIVLPGVGSFAECRRGLDARIVEALDEAVRRKGRPFLGICVGMQLMADRGHEHEVTPGLGWIGGEVERIVTEHKVPHMGWNTLDIHRQHPILEGIAGEHAYFVHSYHFNVARPADLVATSDYGGPVAAIVGRDNMVGTQFHPEKSQRLGLRLITNFLKWKP